MPQRKGMDESFKKKKKLRAHKDEIEENSSLDKAFHSSADLVKFHSDISLRAIVFGKIVYIPFFTSHHIHLRELFHAQGWGNFLSLRQTQYTTLVKHFYTHFHHEKGKSHPL
jgi:hypothetical protein